MIVRRLRHLSFALLLAASACPAAAGAAKVVGDPSLKLVAIPATEPAVIEPSARRASPANDEIEGAADLGTTLPVSRTFTFGAATAGVFEADARAMASLWFRFTARASGFHAVTLAPTATGPSAPVSLTIGDGFDFQIGGFVAATATLAKPLKTSVYLAKGETYYMNANLLASTASLRALNFALRITATPDGVILSRSSRSPQIVRDAATDTFSGNIFGTALFSVYFQDGGRNTPSIEMSASVDYETGPKDVVTVTGLERRELFKSSSFNVVGIISTIPQALKTQGIFRLVTRAVDHTFGLTLEPTTTFVMTDLGGAATSVQAFGDVPLPVPPGAPWVKTIFVRTLGTTTATGCMAMSDRPITWRWYDQTGATALAAANRPVAIAPKVWRRLVVSIPTAKSHLENAKIGLAVDCTNTKIMPIETRLTTSLVPAPKITIDVMDGGKRIDFFNDVLRTLDVRVRNGGTASAVIRLDVDAPFVLSPTFLMQSCLVVSNACTTRFSGTPTFTLANGKTATLRLLIRPNSIGSVAPDYGLSRLTAKAQVRVRRVFDQLIFQPAGSDFSPVSLDCPKANADGTCPPL